MTVGETDAHDNLLGAMLQQVQVLSKRQAAALEIGRRLSLVD